MLIASNLIAPMIQHGMMPQLIPNGSSGPDGDNNSYHGMVGHNVGHNMNGYYNPGEHFRQGKYSKQSKI